MFLLKEIKVIEMEGLAPGPFCGMVLADFGAEVTLVKRPNLETYEKMAYNPLHRNKKTLSLDLKAEQDRETFLNLLKDSDVLIDPFRPGVMERLGLGPKEASKYNPRLIYVRLTGYGQTGPLREKAGHDINYLALSGVLSLFIGEGKKPVPPLNLLADFAGGGFMAAFGTLLALLEREKTKKGVVVDVSMTEGVNYIATFVYGLFFNGLLQRPIGSNRLDGGAPYYQVYETKDARFMAVGAIEEKFYEALLRGLGLKQEDLPSKEDQDSWPLIKEEFKKRFMEKTQGEWVEIFQKLDACVTPVLSIQETLNFPHHLARERFLWQGIPQPAPAPKFSPLSDE